MNKFNAGVQKEFVLKQVETISVFLKLENWGFKLPQSHYKYNNTDKRSLKDPRMQQFYNNPSHSWYYMLLNDFCGLTSVFLQLFWFSTAYSHG